MLNEIMGETIYAEKPNIRTPKEVITNTAIALRNGYICGEFEEDEGGSLYYCGMIEDYGGFLDYFYKSL